MKTDSDTPQEAAGAGSSPSSCSERFEMSDCCNAPVVMFRGYVSLFGFESAAYGDEEDALKELEPFEIEDGAEEWFDAVRVYQDVCAKCRKPIREPWIESESAVTSPNSGVRPPLSENNKEGDNDHG